MHAPYDKHPQMTELRKCLNPSVMLGKTSLQESYAPPPLHILLHLFYMFLLKQKWEQTFFFFF